MKTLLVIGFYLISSVGRCQQGKISSSLNAEIIHLTDYYQAEGVIFNKEYQLEFTTTNVRERFTPSLSDIRKAEEILSGKYNEIRGTDIDVKKAFRKYIRQYVGIIDKSGNKNIIVQLLGYSKKARFKKEIGKSYQKIFIMIFDAAWLKNQIFRVNTDLGTVSTNL